jgi:hypothetical protein
MMAGSAWLFRGPCPPFYTQERCLRLIRSLGSFGFSARILLSRNIFADQEILRPAPLPSESLPS